MPAPDHRAARRADAAALAGALTLLAYVAVRAARVPLTHDEALTFAHYVSQPLAATLRFAGPWPTNDHLLNSLLARLADALFGAAPLALRLPNLLAHASFLLFSWLTLRRRPVPVALAAFAVVNANPLMLELFGLCRGYGLSLGFLMPGLFLALRSLGSSEPSRRDDALAVACVGAGALAQVVVVDVLAPLFGILVARRLLHAIRRRAPGASVARDALPLIAAAAVSAALLAPVLGRFQQAGLLNIGGKAGFWTDTVVKLAHLSFYGAAYASRYLTAALRAGVVLLVLAHAVALATRRPRLAGILALADLTALATILQHHLFRTDYLMDRTAILFVPLAGLALAEAVFALDGAPALLRDGSRAALGGVAAVALVHLLRAGNLDRSYLWWFDADTVRVLDDLGRLPRPPGRAMRLGVVFYSEPSFNFYRVTRGLAWLAPVTRDAPWGPFDYALLNRDQADEARQRGFVPLALYPRTRMTLYRSPALGRQTPVEVTRLVPVVLDVSGAVHYTTDLVIENRGATEATATIDYVPSVGTGLGTASARVPAGGRLEIPGAIGWLRAHGVPIPEAGPRIGTLLVVIEGLSSRESARVTAYTGPDAPGARRLSYSALDPETDGTATRLSVCDLRANDSERSNLAVVNLGADPVTLRVVAREDDGRAVEVAAAETLPLLGWKQYDGVLAKAGLRRGCAVVERVASGGRFSAYGVVMDNRTNEGRWLAPSPLP